MPGDPEQGMQDFVPYDDLEGLVVAGQHDSVGPPVGGPLPNPGTIPGGKRLNSRYHIELDAGDISFESAAILGFAVPILIARGHRNLDRTGRERDLTGG
jgi:hypothetical protein